MPAVSHNIKLTIINEISTIYTILEKIITVKLEKLLFLSYCLYVNK